MKKLGISFSIIKALISLHITMWDADEPGTFPITVLTCFINSRTFCLLFLFAMTSESRLEKFSLWQCELFLQTRRQMNLLQNWNLIYECQSTEVFHVMFHENRNMSRMIFKTNRGILLHWIYIHIKPSSGDLSNDGLFVARSELGRLSSRVVLLIPIHHSIDGPLLNTSSELNFTMGIALIKKRKHRRALSAEVGFMVVVKSQEAKWTNFNMSHICKQWPVTLFLIPTYVTWVI